MKLIPILGPGRNGRREYRTPDGRWRLFRTRNPVRWEVQQRCGADDWLQAAAFVKRRDARLCLEEALRAQNQIT